MIDLLKIVLGAVSTKDIVPVLNNFCLYRSLFNQKGRIQGSDGTLYIDAPFDHPINECTVKADKFIRAIEACDGAPDFGITETGRLSIKNGRFKAYLPTLPATDYPIASQEGEVVSLPPNFVEIITRIKPFISLDASRVWSTSLLFLDGYVYATNNIIIARIPCELNSENHPFGISLPASTIDRILDIKQNPSLCYVADNSVTFEYGPVWMRSQLTSEQWPAIAPMFKDFAVSIAIPADLKDAVEKVKFFCVNEKFPVIKLGTSVSTGTGDQGASVDGFDLPESSFHGDQLSRVLEIATHADFSTYPKPCPFKGPGIEGLIVGIKT